MPFVLSHCCCFCCRNRRWQIWPTYHCQLNERPKRRKHCMTDARFSRIHHIVAIRRSSVVYKTTTGMRKCRSFTNPALDFTLDSDSSTPLAELDVGLQGPCRRGPGLRVDVPRPFSGSYPCSLLRPGTDGIEDSRAWAGSLVRRLSPPC
jgi:hypothetical protein